MDGFHEVKLEAIDDEFRLAVESAVGIVVAEHYPEELIILRESVDAHWAALSAGEQFAPLDDYLAEQSSGFDAPLNVWTIALLNVATLVLGTWLTQVGASGVRELWTRVRDKSESNASSSAWNELNIAPPQEKIDLVTKRLIDAGVRKRTAHLVASDLILALMKNSSPNDH